METDALTMTMTAGADQITVSAAGRHVNILQTAPVSGSLDLIGIEALHFIGNGGADSVVVGDLHGTDVQSVDLNGSPIGGSLGLQAAAPPATVEAGPVLAAAELGAIVEQAIAQWADTTFVTDAELERLEQVTIQLTDLPGLLLGATTGSTVQLDLDAAGFGWFVDPTPEDTTEFVPAGGEYLATSTGGAAGRVDLLTVVLHELGHVLGFQDLANQTTGLMAESLEPGVRRLTLDPAPAPETLGSRNVLGAQPEHQREERVPHREAESKGLIEWRNPAHGALLGRHPLGAWSARRLTPQLPEFVFDLEGRNGAEHTPPLAGLSIDFSFGGEREGTLLPDADVRVDLDLG